MCRECFGDKVSAGRKGKDTEPRVKAPAGVASDAPMFVRQVFRAIAEGILQALGDPGGTR